MNPRIQRLLISCLCLQLVLLNNAHARRNFPIVRQRYNKMTSFLGVQKTPQPDTTTTTTTTTLKAKYNPRWLLIRGGDLGQIRGRTLAKGLALLAFIDAIAASLAPMSSMKWMGIDPSQSNYNNNNNRIMDPKSQRLTYHYLHGIGSSAMTVAVSIYYLTRVVTEEGASSAAVVRTGLFWAFLVRLFSTTFVLGQAEDIGMNMTMFGIMWTMIAGTVAALYFPPDHKWGAEAMVLTKIVSLVLGVHGFFLYCDPDTFVHKVSRKDKEDSMALNMASINGGYMAVSGLVTYLLANGMDPIRVAGYAALAYMPVLVKLIAAIPLDKFMGVDTRVLAVTVSTLLASIAVGTLHD